MCVCACAYVRACACVRACVCVDVRVCAHACACVGVRERRENNDTTNLFLHLNVELLDSFKRQFFLLD